MTREAVCPTETCRPVAIGTSAVAIMEVLTEFKAAPMNSGVVNRHENGLPLTVDSSGGIVDVMERSG